MIRCRRGVWGLVAMAALLFAAFAQAQPQYPQGYFRNPLDIPILLAGNFGECRPGHFHSGLDIKTNGVENLPVRAAADGYISRIKTDPGGFGHALYINHPNGYTTLYAHLNDFNPALQAYLRNEQYRLESWTVDLTLDSTKFLVRKGNLIAYSGNTGGSTAPHLHFEIRNRETEHPLNPQLFGFAIKDTRPPVPLELVFYPHYRPMDWGPNAYYKLVKNKAGIYTIPGTVRTASGFMAGIVANDFMDGSDNTLNFYTAEWSLDGAFAGSIRLDNIGYEETRYLHAYVDYAAWKRDDKWVQLLAWLTGPRFTAPYDTSDMGGHDPGLMMMWENTGSPVHQLSILLKDAAGNQTRIEVPVMKQAADTIPGPCDRQADGLHYQTSNVRFFLPDDVTYHLYGFEARDAVQRGAVSARHTLGSPLVPVHRYVPLLVKPNVPIPFALRIKLALRYSDGKKESGQAAAFDEDGWYKAEVRAFGDYWLVADTTAPVIQLKTPKAALGKASRILFEISDALTSVKTCRAELDGKWILLEQHGTAWFYDVDAVHSPPGPHRLVVKATDQNGNERVAGFDFVQKR